MVERDRELVSMRQKVEALEEMRKWKEQSLGSMVNDGEGIRQYMQQLELTVMNLKSELKETKSLSEMRDNQIQ